MKTETSPDGDTIIRPDADHPFARAAGLMVTPEQASGIHAFIRELKPGVYLKCSQCNKMKYGGSTIHFKDDGVFCEECI